MGKSPIVGAILGDWDEEIGPYLVDSKFDRKLKERPETILLKCFSSAQVIFSYDEFNKISFIIPLLSLGVRAKIYFNLRPDPAVRGGLRPFLFILLMDFESTNDDHFKLFEQEAEQIQQDYQNGFKINFDKTFKKLKEIAANSIQTEKSQQTNGEKQIISTESHDLMLKKELSTKQPQKSQEDSLLSKSNLSASNGTIENTSQKNVEKIDQTPTNLNEKTPKSFENYAVLEDKETEYESLSDSTKDENGNGKVIDIIPSSIEIICNICGKRESLNISKEAIGPLNEIPHKIILKHENHSIKILIDSDYRLIGIHYIKNVCTPDEKEKLLKNTPVNRKLFTVKFGPWNKQELEELKAEIQKGTPLHLIQLKLQRTISQIREQAEKNNWNIEEKY